MSGTSEGIVAENREEGVDSCVEDSPCTQAESASQEGQSNKEYLVAVEEAWAAAHGA